MSKFSVGDKVWKITGDYRLPGEVRAVFTLYDGGPERYVVAHLGYGAGGVPAGRFGHIYSGANLARSDTPEEGE